jgi:hypothetical protein
MVPNGEVAIMSGPQRYALRVTSLAVCLSLFAALAPHSSRAIQLRWSSGATDTSFIANQRCMLIVQADSAEVSLPGSWRLIWTADSSRIQIAAVDSLVACQTDTAEVSGIDPPSTPADSAAGQVTAHLCSAGEPMASTAYFLLELVGGSHGKLKVVALDPADSNVVTESNEVTYNGGVDGGYAPQVLSASSERQGSSVIVTAVGSGLGGVRTADIGAWNLTWNAPLAIIARTESTLVGSAEIPVNIPSSVLHLRGSAGEANKTLPANTSLQPQNVQWVPSGMREAFTQEEKDSLGSMVPPNGRIQPKDFAFLYAGGKFHLFYIRLNMWDPYYRQHPGATDSTEKNFGHAVSTNLTDWDWVVPTRDTTVLQVRPGKWDDFHVWAPSIVQTDTNFVMFYTGVQLVGARQHQQIGLATSPDLINWTRYDAPILSVLDIPWAKKGTVVGLGQQLRDPFVMPDPANAGHWLMYFVAVDTSTQASMAVGVARSSGDFFRWTADQNPLRSTDSTHLAARRVESPHAFSHGDRWWLFFSPVDPPGASNVPPAAPVTFEMDTTGSPVDSIAAHWTRSDTLAHYQNPDNDLGYWHASEHLVVGPHEYLAAWDDWNMRVAISEMNWYGPHDFILGSASTALLGVAEGAGRRPAGLELALLGVQPVRVRMAMRLQLPAAMHARLAIYDVAGRRVRVVLDRNLAAGETAATWDGCNAAGAAVGSGVYFARLATVAGTRVIKAVLLR